MNTIIRKNWQPRLYLDALGSASVIAASVLVFLAAAVIALSEIAPRDVQAEVCPAGRFAQVELTDQRPGVPPTATGAACV